MHTFTRRELLDMFFRAALPLYGEREARSVAHLAIEELCGLSKIDIAMDPLAEVTVTDKIRVAADELAKGRPVQYIVGKAEFCGLDFSVDERVLIPRPETEELVAWVYDCAVGAGKVKPVILDVGTGSGAIAVALASRLEDADITGIDISTGALEVAGGNAKANNVAVNFLRADILCPVEVEGKLGGRRFNFIVSNPPYIPESDRERMHMNVTEHEPGGALFVPDSDPLVFYRAIAEAGVDLLAAGGELFFEIYEHFAADVGRMLTGAGYNDVEVRRDIHGRERMIRCRKE